jgi:beta-lactamase regulating signal transducer with metallopeptidase domain
MNSTLQYLAILSWVTTVVGLSVALVRVPLRGTLGARAAYWLWLTVPASALAVALPRAAHKPVTAVAGIAWDVFGLAWDRITDLIAMLHVSGQLSAVACAVWALGAGTVSACMVLRQRAFVRSLGALVRLPDGTWRGRGVAEPLLLGAWRPRVLVPLDFERRYSVEERQFVLAHERAHMQRGDTLANALGAAWLCVFWFNPVMFWVVRLLRLDQDLACDAAVLATAGRGSRSRYAQALLKTQLAGEGTLRLPLACHWRSAHPLRQRIAALRGPMAGRIRHGLGTLCVATLVAVVSLGASAIQPCLRAATSSAFAPSRHSVCRHSRVAAREGHQAQLQG